MKILHDILLLPEHVGFVYARIPNDYRDSVEIVCQGKWLPEATIETGLKEISPIYVQHAETRQLLKLLEIKGLDT